jgi:hypothetical protein
MDKYLSYLDFWSHLHHAREGLYAVNPAREAFLIYRLATWNFALGYGREEIIEAAQADGRTGIQQLLGNVTPKGC